MSSPFYLLEKISFARKIMEDEYIKRARQIVKRISPFIDKIEKKNSNITCVDVRLNPLCKSIPVIIYDGKKLPFQNETFDISLLIAVLHHCNEPLQVLDEAIRVSSKKIVI